MKAFKGCTNKTCVAFKKEKYKDSDLYCSKCGEPLSYVCADCWKVMDNNSERFCIGCATAREQKRAQAVAKVKSEGKKAAGVAAAAAPVVVKYVKESPKIIDGAKKVAKAGADVVKLVKK